MGNGQIKGVTKCRGNKQGHSWQWSNFTRHVQTREEYGNKKTGGTGKGIVWGD